MQSGYSYPLKGKSMIRGHTTSLLIPLIGENHHREVTQTQDVQAFVSIRQIKGKIKSIQLPTRGRLHNV